MKVTVSNNAPPPSIASSNDKAAIKRNTPADSAEESSAANAAAQNRDFASVLEDVTRARNRRDEESIDTKRPEAKTSERAETERAERRREERRDGETGGNNNGGNFHQTSGVREFAAHGDSVGARAILHIADLERMIAAVRTQALAGGGREVTLELHRSVLEGLRVKLSTDAKGRVSAEFIAATEKVRAQLEARAQDLTDLLRSRGVDVASLRTTVASDSGHDSAKNGSGDTHAAFGALDEASPARIAPPDEASAHIVEPTSADGDSTYRA